MKALLRVKYTNNKTIFTIAHEPTTNDVIVKTKKKPAQSLKILLAIFQKNSYLDR